MVQDYLKPPTKKEVESFLHNYGSRGKLLIELIEDKTPEINELIKTGIGWELVKQDVTRFKNVAELVLNGTATDLEKAEVKYLYFNRIPHVVETIKLWVQGLETIANGGKDVDARK
jgi:hypothetical protein